MTSIQFMGNVQSACGPIWNSPFTIAFLKFGERSGVAAGEERNGVPQRNRTGPQRDNLRRSGDEVSGPCSRPRQAEVAAPGRERAQMGQGARRICEWRSGARWKGDGPGVLADSGIR